MGYPKIMHGLTVARLHKMLGKMIEKGDGRKYVAVAKDTFKHNCEGDGVTILDVHDCRLEWINIADDDGGVGFDSKGRERGRGTAVLFGSSVKDRRASPVTPTQKGGE